MQLTIALTCLMLVGFAQGAIPTESTCLSAFERAGLDELQSSLTPCAFSASSTCCNNIANLVGLDAESEFAGCLCNQGVIDLMIDEIEANSLAQSIGFDGDRLLDVLRTCNAPFAGTPSCASAPVPSPPSVAVDVEATGVSVSVGTTTVPSAPPKPQPTKPFEDAVMPETPPEPMTDTREKKGPLDGLKGMVGKPGTMTSGMLGKKKKGLGLKNKKKELFSDVKGKLKPEPKESTTFEDARKKLDLIKKNLAATRNTITDSMLDSKKKVLDTKAGTPSSMANGMTVEPRKTASTMGMNEEMVTLIPVEVDDNEAANAVPVDIAMVNGVARVRAMN